MTYKIGQIIEGKVTGYSLMAHSFLLITRRKDLFMFQKYNPVIRKYPFIVKSRTASNSSDHRH